MQPRNPRDCSGSDPSRAVGRAMRRLKIAFSSTGSEHDQGDSVEARPGVPIAVRQRSELLRSTSSTLGAIER